MAQKFSKKEVIRAGWNTMKKNFWFFAGITAFLLVVSYAPSLIFAGLEKIELPAIAIAFFFVAAFMFWAIQLIISIGLVYISIKFVSGAKPKFMDLFAKANKVLAYFVSSFLYGLIMAAGFILLIIPGIIFAIRFQFYQYYIVDKDKGPIQSLKASWAATKGSVWNLILLWLLMLVINLAGALALGIGLFLTIPTTMIAMAAVYKKLDTAKNA